ncbi:hypothetical protein PHYPSEUDO_004829 [Phytophthora pseudosyringae]|uniref:Uncharacterized protein n=1 Tax=Phytophthora pseudosyringae TaxID=221518 RepID=A0A8T1VSQ4_9STRA|nr:hypothetical protein PHYPSEUDO_004829 [Phytophthora pseudosyringae]
MPRIRALQRTHELTEDAVENGVARLAQMDEARQMKRTRCALAARDAVSADNDPVDSLSPVFDRFMLSGGEAVMQTTNFSEGEVIRLWRAVEEYVVLRWNVGHGKKCKDGGKDGMFMMLTALKLDRAHRVLVKNYFGRLASLWAVVSD